MKPVTASPTTRLPLALLAACLPLVGCGYYDDKVPGIDRPDSLETSVADTGATDGVDALDAADTRDDANVDTLDPIDTAPPTDADLDTQGADTEATDDVPREDSDDSGDSGAADTAPDPCPDGQACDDGSACTVGDHCEGHVCIGVLRACDDQNACNGVETCDPSSGCLAGVAVDCRRLDGVCARGLCDPASGECTVDILPDGTVCDDADLCTVGEACDSGQCRPATTVSCGVLDACHQAGTCNPASGTCVHPAVPDGAICDDGVACSRDDRCVDGTCIGTSRACDDGLACTVDRCDEGSGECVSDASACPCDSDSDCDDGNLCNGAERCDVDLRCHAGTPVSCAQLDDACQVGSCVAATGLCESRDRPNGTTCDDQNACTGADRCAAGLCVGDAKVCVASDPCHLPGTCDPASGACTDPARPDGSGCDDGLRCTRADSCQSGVCGGAPVSCTALDACHDIGSCDPTTGQCSNPDAPEQTACDDANACTLTDVCLSGTCAGRNPVICAPAGSCRAAGLCDPVSGACSDPPAQDGLTCSDNNLCTEGDTCQGGACAAGAPKTCVSANPCLGNGLCAPETGQCSFSPRPEGTSCSDSDACTTGDRCIGATCTPTGQVSCVALDQCHVAGVCNAQTGVCTNPNKPNGSSCSLGTCTADTCQTGTCQAGPSTCYPGQLCSGGACACDSAATSFATDVKPIFTNNCGPCHLDTVASGGSSGLNLSSQFAFAELVGVDSEQCFGANARKRVKPDAPSESYLMHKTRGVLLCSGSRMPPPPSAALSAAQLATIGRWICQGAKNN